MSQYNDCMNAALLGQGYGPDSVQDMLYQYLLANGGLAGNLNDLWHQVWDSLAIPSGTFDDRAYIWLTSLGYSGSLSDMWLGFWCDGGYITLATNLLLNSRLCDDSELGTPTGWTKSVHADDGIALFERLNGVSKWLVSRDGSIGTATLIQTLAASAAGNYVASFRIDTIFAVTNHYKVGLVSGPNVTETQSFPSTDAIVTPSWVHCFFNNSAIGDVDLVIQAVSADTSFEGIVASRPQIIEDTKFIVADWTGTECTGNNISMLVDANGEVIKDASGNYLYVPI